MATLQILIVLPHTFGDLHILMVFPTHTLFSLELTLEAAPSPHQRNFTSPFTTLQIVQQLA
jgi:hypothetical protein